MSLSKSEAGKLGASKLKENLHNKYYANPKLCKECSQALSYEKRKNTFCCSSCSVTHNNKKRTSTRPTCLVCDNTLGKNNKTYCSTACQKEKEWEDRKEAIRQGTYTPTPSVLRKFIIEYRGYRCDSCEETEWLGQPIPLEMDHIDGNSDNNAIINLRMLCCNCHALTNTYKNRNRGSGRAFRRQRYKEGKSY